MDLLTGRSIFLRELFSFLLFFQVRANQFPIRNVSRGGGDELRRRNSESFHGCESIVEGEAERDLPQRWGPLSGDSVVHRLSLERDGYFHEHAAPRRDGKKRKLSSIYVYVHVHIIEGEKREEKQSREFFVAALSTSSELQLGQRVNNRSFRTIVRLVLDRTRFLARFHPNFIDKVRERESEEEDFDRVKIKFNKI